ncbi:MAG: transglycosylase SLT domain-containing protein [Rhizobiales bacterium]|nr:transglycosylase SLT domain-containing protein [Hyphomicrobiales bacterium]
MLSIRRARFALISTLALAVALGSVPALAAKTEKTPPKKSQTAKPNAAKPNAKAEAKKKPDAKKLAAKGHAARTPLPKQPPVPRTRPAVAGMPAPAQPPARKLIASAVPMLISPAAAAVPTTAAEERSGGALAYAPAAAPTSNDIAVMKEAIELARRGKISAANDRKADIRDAVGQKLVEWTILRAASDWLPFSRYAAFVNTNPTWPSVGLLRRRAEGQLPHERAEAGAVPAYFSKHDPLSAKGKLVYARALLAGGERAEAQRLIRELWREDGVSDDLEQPILDTFGTLLSRGDHEARLHRRLYADDFGAAMRAARRLGGYYPAVVEAAVAVEKRAKNAGALIESVPAEARRDPAYMFSRIRWLRRGDRLAEAAQMMLAVPRDANAAQDSDEWWIERRVLVRQLLDADNAQAAYRIARDSVTPAKRVYAVDQQFTAGWIALRFLNDPNTARRHFAEMAQGTHNHIALGRAGYWLGRAAEAAGRNDEARRYYESGAQYATSYYGQLARARLGAESIGLRRPPAIGESQRLSLRQTELVRAAEMLYAAGQSELVIPFVHDVADRLNDPAALVVLGETAARNKDARVMLIIGKAAVGKGYALDHFAFPNFGMPKVASIGPEIDYSLIYAIARQESAFNQNVVSVAKAMGLMQVTPAAGKYIARKFSVTYNESKLRHDPAYNTQMGAAEISDLVRDYDGNYIMAFAAYNAGRGRVREWIGRFGDPRDPNVDPVDWVERIPFSETRNYVQRVMENLQVYRARFGNSARLTIEADIRGSRR